MIATAEIVGKVRRLLNEAESDEQLSLLSEDTRSIDEHIIALLPQAVAMTQRNKGEGCGCVNSRSAGGELLPVADSGKGCAVVSLPNDFVSLVSLQLEGWQRFCTRLYSAGSAVAAAQNNPLLRAGVCRPVAVESVGNDGARVALLYPSQGDAPRFSHFVYEAEFNADEGLDGCSNQLADAVAYNCAALLYSVFERPDAANMFLSLAMALCNGNNIERR